VKLAKAVDPHIEAPAVLPVSSSKAHRSPDRRVLGNGQPVSLCSRSSQAHKGDRSRNGLQSRSISRHTL
jgi:hypothetical protein